MRNDGTQQPIGGIRHQRGLRLRFRRLRHMVLSVEHFPFRHAIVANGLAATAAKECSDQRSQEPVLNERAMPVPRDAGFPRQMLRFSHDVSVVAVVSGHAAKKGGAPQGLRQVMPSTAEIIAQRSPVRLVE